jgi:4-hydroxybenzoate polyprenyltransferase
MHQPWQKHLGLALVLLAIAFAAAEFWNPMAGAAVVAAAVFVALRPLFRNRDGRRED